MLLFRIELDVVVPHLEKTTYFEPQITKTLTPKHVFFIIFFFRIGLDTVVPDLEKITYFEPHTDY